MKEIQLDPRLSTIAHMVSKGEVVADIGTDHGYVIGWLAQNHIISKGYACDINEKPLQSAYDTLLEHDLIAKIKTVLTNGLQGLESLEITTFIIAGMGGELISNILEQSPWCQNSDYTFLLQPMTKDATLRQWLYQNGFAITEEQAVESGKFVYTVMRVQYVGTPEAISLHFAWSGRLWEQEDPQAQQYLKRKFQYLKNKRPSFVEGDGYEELYSSWKERFCEC